MTQFALTPTQIDDLKLLLRDRERQLEVSLDSELHTLDPEHASITTQSDADWTTADVDADTLIARAERHAAALADTRLALSKVADGRYGTCERCGQGIGYERLIAYPSARRCLACQAIVERGMAGHAKI